MLQSRRCKSSQTDLVAVAGVPCSLLVSFAGRGVCFLRLSPPTSGLARRRRQRGAQLDVEFAFNASRRRLRALPRAGPGAEGLHFIVFLSHCFGPGPEAMTKGHMDKEFAGGVRSKEALERLLQFPVLETT